MLKIKNEWRFKRNVAISREVNKEFVKVITQLARGEQRVFESFKTKFAEAAGQIASTSSNANWASTDLQILMIESIKNAATYIEAFYNGWESLGRNFPIDLQLINTILSQNEIRYQIIGEELVQIDLLIIPSESVPKSILENAKEKIEASFSRGDQLMQEGQPRHAVQEIVWLLESISTIFTGKELNGQIVQGNYFNQIIKSLARQNEGTTFKRVLDWLEKLFGYLSSPQGGAIRHGLDLSTGVEPTSNECRLYYNLIKSYIHYLLEEYSKIEINDDNA